MKRLNRKKLIEQFEELREGFAAMLTRDLNIVDRIAIESYHLFANKCVVELGGNSVDTIKIRNN